MNSDITTAIIGAGSWGTALACVIAGKGLRVNLWGHRGEHVQRLAEDRRNDRYLKGIPLPENIAVFSNLTEAIENAQVICMVVPSHVYRGVFREIANHSTSSQIFVSATKGIENETLMTMNEIMVEELSKRNKSGHTAIITGPSFAAEVARHVPTAITVGSKKKEVAHNLQSLFNTDYLRVYTSNDTVGLEIAAALKNIIAIATGICDGLQFGSNARAALITRGLAEISRLGKAMGAQEKTFFGLSGLGDLVLTCTGDLSRNRYVGLELGKGRKLTEIIDSMEMVAEGIKTTKSVHQLSNRLNVETPIISNVYQILYEGKDCLESVKELMNRDLKEE